MTPFLKVEGSDIVVAASAYHQRCIDTKSYHPGSISALQAAKDDQTTVFAYYQGWDPGADVGENIGLGSLSGLRETPETLCITSSKVSWHYCSRKQIANVSCPRFLRNIEERFEAHFATSEMIVRNIERDRLTMLVTQMCKLRSNLFPFWPLFPNEKRH